jgi:hypothetical protein
VLEAVFILLEFPSPSRRIFIGSHSLPPSLVRRFGPSLFHVACLKEDSKAATICCTNLRMKQGRGDKYILSSLTCSNSD